MSNPSKKHWEAMKGVMQYLNGTRELCICFGSKEAFLEGYSDANYARDVDKWRFAPRYVFMLIGGAISWQSYVQKCVSMSTTKAKYISTLKACKEEICLAFLVKDLGVSIEMPTLHHDN